MPTRYGIGYYDCKKFTFNFQLGGDDQEHQWIDGPEFSEERVESGHLPSIFQKLNRKGWKLVTSCNLPTHQDEVLFIFTKEVLQDK